MSETYTTYGVGPDKPVSELQALRDEVSRLRGALERIAKYGDNGICPYGCDTPHIAQVALTPQGGKGGGA